MTSSFPRLVGRMARCPRREPKEGTPTVAKNCLGQVGSALSADTVAPCTLGPSLAGVLDPVNRKVRQPGRDRFVIRSHGSRAVRRAKPGRQPITTEQPHGRGVARWTGPMPGAPAYRADSLVRIVSK